MSRISQNLVFVRFYGKLHVELVCIKQFIGQ
jgi:hypothetical protein